MEACDEGMEQILSLWQCRKHFLHRALPPLDPAAPPASKMR